MARTANKTANDMFIRQLVDGDIIDASGYMFGHLIGGGVVEVENSPNDDGSDPVTFAAINVAADGTTETVGVQSFSLDTPNIYLVATVTSGVGILVLTGARNTPVTQDADTYVYETVLQR